ncbi:hypothetical protein COOONC_01340 [Cooperia oncophora]
MRMVTSNKNPRIDPTNDCSAFFVPKTVSDTYEFQLRRFIEDKFMVKLETYADFHKWSCENYAQFWESVLIFCGIKLGSSYIDVSIFDSIAIWRPKRGNELH